MPIDPSRLFIAFAVVVVLVIGLMTAYEVWR